MSRAFPAIPDLRGKVVLITGASTGIGAAAARAFGASGSRIGVHYNASRDAAEAVLIRRLMQDPERLASLAGAARRRGRPDATREVVSRILTLVSPPQALSQV